MKFLKKAWRLLCLVLLVGLAITGIGLGGGVPIPANSRKENHIEISVELPESKEETKELEEFFRKQ
jgi:hypothetical protein